MLIKYLNKQINIYLNEIIRITDIVRSKFLNKNVLIVIVSFCTVYSCIYFLRFKYYNFIKSIVVIHSCGYVFKYLLESSFSRITQAYQDSFNNIFGKKSKVFILKLLECDICISGQLLLFWLIVNSYSPLISCLYVYLFIYKRKENV